MKMKITIIHGTMRHGSTWHAVDAVIQALARHVPTEVTEFFLPRDMPNFCAGCFTCFLRGEDKCPHAPSVQPIVQTILEADLVVLASPVYVYDVSAQIKALLDHLGYLWLPHRPAPEMFSKVGLTVVTTAGAGAKRAGGTLRKSFTFWGVRRVYSLGGAVASNGWEGVTAKRRAKITRAAESVARRIERSIAGKNRIPYPPFRALLFKMMAGMQKKNVWGALDRAHWENNGWLSGKKPF
jgi:multimeric flavodoxin WrbA